MPAYLSLFLIALAIYATTASLVLLLSHPLPRLGSAIGAAGAILAGALGLFGAFGALTPEHESIWRLSGEIVFHGGLLVGADSLSAFFLVPVFAVSALGALYGRAYMMHSAKTQGLGVHWAAYNLLAASMVAVVIARDALTFLFAWEVMTLSAFVLVTFDHEVESVRRAGWVYLIASHVAFAALMAMFLLLSTKTGSLAFESFESFAWATGESGWFVAAIFAFALAGFGIKAGFFPLHVWLPEAHAAAPSHVSALMSGVLIKMGLYGLLRVFVLLRFSAAWWALMAIGLGGGIIGVAVALYQRDMKRVLAYSSVENVGVIALGLGLGMYGIESHSPRIAAFAFSGALLHLWNHALMKALLFFGAGSVLCATGTKDLDRLGGVLKRMPWTGSLMIGGACAISALPPMNGFAGEWLIYLGLAEPILTGPKNVFLLLSMGLFAFLGAVACLCFVRLVGIGLLGTARSDEAERAHESPPAMIFAMAALCSACVLVGLSPARVVLILRPAADLLAGAPSDVTGPLSAIGALDQGLWAGLGAIAVLIAVAVRRGGASSDATWGCGYLGASSRIQYVARSFSELFAEHLIPRPFRARLESRSDGALFSPSLQLSADDVDPATRGVYEPFLARWAGRLFKLRRMQHGSLHLYLVYILAIALLGVAWVNVRSWWQP